MDERRGSETWEERTDLAKDIKAMIDIVLKHYDPEMYAGLGVVMRLDGRQIVLKHNEKSWPPSENKGGILRIDYMKKIEVKKRSQQVKNESGRTLYDLHDRMGLIYDSTRQLSSPDT